MKDILVICIAQLINFCLITIVFIDVGTFVKTNDKTFEKIFSVLKSF